MKETQLLRPSPSSIASWLYRRFVVPTDFFPLFDFWCWETAEPEKNGSQTLLRLVRRLKLPFLEQVASTGSGLRLLGFILDAYTVVQRSPIS